MRLLGDQLIQSGFHVMRFDYSCMGDSWGEFDGASVEQWVADIQVAAEELRDNAGVRQISIVGLRLGATLAYAAAKEVSLHHLVLLDPVPQGRAYLDRLRGMQTRLRQTWPHAPACMGGAEHEDLLGYRYAAGLVEQIGKLDLGAAPIPQANRVSWVLSAEDPHCKQLHTQLDEKRIKGEFRVISETGSWEAVEDDLYAEPMLLPTMRRMVPEILGE
jgi:pimeloyl-ACP methyl ester carboxylesterase